MSARCTGLSRPLRPELQGLTRTAPKSEEITEICPRVRPLQAIVRRAFAPPLPCLSLRVACSRVSRSRRAFLVYPDCLVHSLAPQVTKRKQNWEQYESGDHVLLCETIGDKRQLVS
jgi:hypothetical protein